MFIIRNKRDGIRAPRLVRKHQNDRKSRRSGDSVPHGILPRCVAGRKDSPAWLEVPEEPGSAVFAALKCEFAELRGSVEYTGRRFHNEGSIHCHLLMSISLRRS